MSSYSSDETDVFCCVYVLFSSAGDACKHCGAQSAIAEDIQRV